MKLRRSIFSPSMNGVLLMVLSFALIHGSALRGHAQGNSGDDFSAQASGKGKPGGGGGGGTPTGSAVFSGRATAFQANVLGITTVISDAGPIGSSGGQAGTSLLTANVPGLLSVGVLNASTVGEGKASRSEASVASLSLSVAGLIGVEAGFVMSRATALCASVSGKSEILDLKINGKSIRVSGGVNQTIDLIVGKVIINEQIASAGGITVNALRVVIPNVADVIVSSAHAGIQCTGTPGCGAGDFVTGGGWITGTPSGAKGNFGVGGGLKNGQLWGHLTYNDHGSNGPKVKGKGVTSYSVLSTSTRRIEGLAEINGQPGTYIVEVTDNGEPGRYDTFKIVLSNGYSAFGLLGGGNIQLHGTGACN